MITQFLISDSQQLKSSMAGRNFNSPFQLIERLIERENYRSWAVAMRAYLEVEDLWDTIEDPMEGDSHKSMEDCIPDNFRIEEAHSDRSEITG